MKYSLIANPEHSENEIHVAKIVEKLKDVELEARTAELIGKEGVSIDNLSGDVLIVLGGDGTILYTLQHINIPIFPINTGSVGFLSETAANNDYNRYLDELEKKNYEIEDVQRIDLFCNKLKMGTALNEVVLHAAHVSRIQTFEIKVNDQSIETVRSDGIIIATPTGSTAYAMSVGSPIINPNVPCFVIVAIAPYSMNSRPIIISDEETLSIKILTDKETVMVMDGQEEIAINMEDDIEINRSEEPAKLIRFSTSFFERMNTKLRKEE